MHQLQLKFNGNSAKYKLIKKRVMDDDFFLVVIDPYETDTCDYADYVLPGVTFMESEDIQNDQISGYVCYNAQSVKPLGEK